MSDILTEMKKWREMLVVLQANAFGIPPRMILRDFEPCGHPGCLSHVSHPCEGCGRIGGRRLTSVPADSPTLANANGSDNNTASD